MNEEDRPDPEELLKSIKREETQFGKGKLKIFLGMAAGVGKTYAMLESAQKLNKEGVYVVIGAIDTHGRAETAKLLDGLQLIPEKKIKYKDTVLEELDIDAILKCKPHLVLVDELAHSNVPGSRHPKRWQDVVELLDHGIDVYTTLNVQHIESLKDLVEKITGITIRETVPDLVVDKAASIELLDLSPDELLRRLKEGKVYLGDQSVIAARNFFQEDKLTALRELSLRYAAEKVEHDLQGMVSSIERPAGWKLRERLLVAVSHSPHSQKLIRITRRLAFNLDAPWLAVHVNTGQILSQEEEDRLTKNIALARDLGGEVITVFDSDIAYAIQRVARQRSVTQIIIGRQPQRWWLLDYFQRNTLMDHLARECSDIDLHVIRQTLFPKSYRRRKVWFHPSSPLLSYALAGGYVITLSLFSWFFLSDLSYHFIGFIFLLGLLSLSLFFKRGPIFFASILYALIWGIFFIPDGSHSIFPTEDGVLLILYLLTGIITGVLVDRERRNKEMLEKREKSSAILYNIVGEIAKAPSLPEALNSVKEGLGSAIGGHFEIILKEMNNGLIFDGTIPLLNNDKEKAAANWVFQNSQEAGWSTSTLPFAKSFYLPLKGLKEVVGVLSYQPPSDKELSAEDKSFIYTVAHQLANYLERSFSEERVRQLQQHEQVEKTYQSILQLITNLFEGPLMTVQDGVKALKHAEETQAIQEMSQPIERIHVSSQSLQRILENISAMVNLSAGLTPVNKAFHDLKELVNRCATRMQKSMSTYQWKISLEDSLPLIPFDYDLIELLLYNLVFHALEFTLPESTIDIEIKQIGDHVVVSIAGEGQNIPPEMIDVSFEKFYRVSGTASDGLGLGLAIAKTIVEIHNGVLKVNNRPQGGMMFSLSLPIA
jgi:two-component system, OmpR family, sensor histidine kinase KdpD